MVDLLSRAAVWSLTHNQKPGRVRGVECTVPKPCTVALVTPFGFDSSHNETPALPTGITEHLKASPSSLVRDKTYLLPVVRPHLQPICASATDSLNNIC